VTPGSLAPYIRLRALGEGALAEAWESMALEELFRIEANSTVIEMTPHRFCARKSRVWHGGPPRPDVVVPAARSGQARLESTEPGALVSVRLHLDNVVIWPPGV
jgi:hypothetical protein